MGMEYVSRLMRAQVAAKRWESQHGPKFAGWRASDRTPVKEIYDRLVGLGPNPSPSMVDLAIGNDSWTKVSCDECSKDVEDAIVLGDNLDNVITICHDCLKRASEMIVTERTGYAAKT